MNTARILRPRFAVHPPAPIAKARTHAPRAWGPQAEPVDPLDTQLRMRAMSILSGPLLGQCPNLTLAQARDVVTWHRPSTT